MKTKEKVIEKLIPPHSLEFTDKLKLTENSEWI
jgi:hypothetical protein